MRTTSLLAVLTSLLAVPCAHAQSFNIDVGDNTILFPVPMDSYAGAAGQTGRWNNSKFPYNTALVNLDGTPSPVTTSSTTSSSFGNFFCPLTGDDYNFMADIQVLPYPPAFPGATYGWTFSGLVDGNYTVYTYAWAPENNGNITSVKVVGSPDPVQLVGGMWTGSPHVLGQTYARHQVQVSGGTLVLEVVGTGTSSGSINGFQLVMNGATAQPFCFGDGSGTVCPCSPAPVPHGVSGRGCPNNLFAGGALLAASGIPSLSADTLVLHGSSMINAPCLYFQGDAQVAGGSGTVFGDGLRCVTTAVKRFAVQQNSSNASQYPGVGNNAISVAGAIGAPGPKHYQCWYRSANAAFCPPATFNLTNGLTVTWIP